MTSTKGFKGIEMYLSSLMVTGTGTHQHVNRNAGGGSLLGDFRRGQNRVVRQTGQQIQKGQVKI